MAECIKPIDTRDELAKIANVSHGTMAKVEKIEKQAPLELKEQIRSGDISINQAYQSIRNKERGDIRESVRIANQQKVERLNTPLEAVGLFQTIVIDPPWDCRDEGDVNPVGRGVPDYAAMAIDEIIALPVGKIADDNCHLYLWAVNRYLKNA